MIIAFDGPEKAGKSTIIGKVAERFRDSTIRHWGKVSSEAEYTNPVMQDAALSNVVFWDRGWASEHVYASLLGRVRNLADDPWLGEWLFGRIADSSGAKIMILPKRWEDSASRRDSSDLPVDPKAECEAFEAYGKRFGYHLIYNEYTERSDAYNVDKIHKLIISARYKGPLEHPYWLDPRFTKAVFVTYWPTKKSLPFTGRVSELMARSLGDDALKCGWTSTDILPDLLYGKMTISTDDESKAFCDGLDRVFRFHIDVWNDSRENNQLQKIIKEMFKNG